MTTYQIAAPDGKTYEIEGPPGASQEQVKAEVLRQNPYAASTTEQLKAAPAAPFSAKDVGVAGASGVVGGLGSLASIFGAETTPAKYLREKQENLQKEISPARQEEMQRRDEISKRAESLGLGEQISSGIAGVAEAPLQGIAQGIGSSVPAIAATLAASVASAPVAIAAGVGLTAKLIFGALQGVGETKSSIYQRVKSELEKSGKSPAEAEAEAIKSQEYLNTKNIPGLAAGAAVGMLDMVTGVEKYAPKAFLKPKVPTGLGALPTKPLTAPTKIGMTARSTLEEMVPEGIQGGTGQAVENLALTNAGIETPLMQGVAGAAARDAVIGGLTGAAISPVSYRGEKREFEAKKQAQDIQKAAADYAQQEKTKEQLGVPELLALPAPPKRTITPPVVNELINPLGDVTRDELNPDVAKYIDEYRQENGLPRLQSFSIEDVKNAMTQKNPEGEKAALDSIVAAKSGFTGEQPYSPQDVLNAAEEKNISVGTKGFNDFLGRTTGTNDLNALSQPQLYAAFKALKAMQAAPEPTVLPEGSNATTFTQSQYNNAVGILQAQPRSVTELMPLIKAATGIKEDRDARAIIDTAAKNDVITLEKVNEVEQATPSKPVEPAKVRAQLPAGYDIREEEFQEGEGPAKYDIYTPDNKVLGSAPDQAAAQEKVTRLQELRTKRAEQMDANVKKAEDQIAKSQGKLDKMEADGKVGTEIYQKLQAAQPGKVRVLNARIGTFKQAKEGFLVPLAFKPVGKKVKSRKGHTVYQDGKSTVTLPTRAAAEEHVLANLPDEELAKVASDTRFGGITNRAAKEQNRRTSAPEGIAVKTTTGTDEGLVRAGVTVKGRTAQITEIGNKLRAALDKFGLNDVALKITSAIENNAEGSYAAKLIQVALNVDNPIRVMRHEAFHALKELGFFTPQQYTVLENQAKKSWINKYLKGTNVELDGKTMSRYDGYVYINQTEPNNWNRANPDKSPKAVLNDQQMQELLIEEAIAEAFKYFDVNGAPPGMMTALLNKLRSLFTALQNALTGAGFQTYEDIFGKVERGEMKATKAEAKAAPKMSLAESTDAWKADKQTIQNAEEYEKENGIRPYVSEGFIDLPKDGTKYSLQAFNPDKHLSYDAVLGVPINRDGTITLYYHTTKENAVNISNKKVISSEGRNRVYLTNESVGADVLRNRGNFDQDLDGSTVLVYAHPELLQMDMEHSNGRKDFYIPVAQGDFFNKKMKLQSIQKSRTSAITDVFSYKDHEAKIADAVQSYKLATAAERRQLVSSARKLLKQEHNVSSLLSENGKLEKTRVNEYDLDWDGNSVASMGLGLASAQQISDKVSTCPRSAICEGLCLGETSGGNLMFGGAASEDVNDIQKSSFRAAARMMQYLKTEALVIHPKEFATLLQAEIDSLNKWCASETQIKVNKETKKRYNEAKEIYQPAVRLNVTSDFKPSMFRAIIEENPNIEFYDYTKLGSESIAKNHHLTYSSTGFGQVVDGEKVFFKDRAGNYDHNWATMRSRLNNGKNVAMAFSSKSGIPSFLNDEETGNTYRVWNGDDYDARFLDPKQPDGKGMIIGLKNKAGTLSEKTATKKTGGFFVKYDPKTDGETVVVPDQQQFQTKLAKKTIPIKQEKLSLRAPTTPEFKRWFGDSKVVDENGEPLVVYHGTPYDFVSGRSPATFNTKDFGALLGKGAYFTADPTDAEQYAGKAAYGGKPNIIPAYVSLKNPYITDSIFEKLPKQNELSAKGYDGVLLKNKDGSVKWAVAFEPTQIKSATGNIGTYDPTNPDIRYSLRKAPDTPEFKRSFGNSKIVDKDGNPKVMYHGTARDISEFRPHQAGAIFVTDNPDTAERYTQQSLQWLSDQAPKTLNTRQMAEAVSIAKSLAKANGYTAKQISALVADKSFYKTDEFREAVTKFMDEGPNILPLYIRAENPFDYDNPDHVKAVMDKVPSVKKESFARTNNWNTVEGPDVLAAIKELGFDAFYVSENGDKNLAVFEPTQVKSAIGNRGTYDITNPDIRYSLKSASKGETSYKALYKGELSILTFVRNKDNIITNIKILNSNNKIVYEAESESSLSDAEALQRLSDINLIKPVKSTESLKTAATVGKQIPTPEYQHNSPYSFVDNNNVEYYVGVNNDQGIAVKVPKNLHQYTNGEDRIIFRNGDNRRNVYSSNALPAFVPKELISSIAAHLNNPNIHTEDTVNGIKMAVESPVNSKLSLREFKKSDLPKNKKEYTLPEDTLLYHGSHETRAKEIEAAGRILIPRSPIKTSGGTPDEGGLVFFGNKESATRYANSEADPFAVQLAEEQGENRQPGVVFETATDRPYRLMNKDYILTQQQADDLNKVLGIPDYKLLRKGDTADTAAFRAVTNSRTVDRYQTNKGEMVAAWPKIFDTLGYDGYYDDFAVALTADNGIRLVGKGGKMERFSLRNQINAMPNGAAINASIDRITPGREVKGFVQRITQALSGDTVSILRAAFLNRYNRLSEYDKKLAEKMGGAALLANSSAEAAALHSDLGAGLTAAAFGVHDKVGGIPVFKNGMTTISNQNGTVKGPLAIFYDLAAMGDPRAYQMYQFWAGAKRGTRFLANGTEENYTQKELDEAKELGVKYPQFEKIQKEWIKYNNGLVKFMVDTGVLSPEGASEMIKYGDYIPFYRQLEGEATVGPNIFQSIGGVRAPKKYKGGTEAPLADFLETIVRNTQASIQAGIKNVAAERAKTVAVELGQATRLNAPSSAPSVFTVLEKGKKVYYDSADKLFIDAISALNIADLPFIGILSAPANALRNLVTKDPGFMMVNLMRDSMSAWVTSGAKMTPIASTVANYGRAIAGTSPTFTALLNAGVLGGYDYSRGVEQSGQALAKQLRKVSGTQTTAEKAAMPFTGVWDALEKGSMASDAATRMSVYDATLKATGNDVEALHRALEVMNFNRKGSSAVIRILTAAIPFLNARMQGLDILYRAGFGQMATADAAAIQKAFLIRGLTIMGLTALYYGMTHDDDDYKKQEQEVRDNNWLVPSLGIRIPIPFEVGVIFKVIPERIMALTFGSDTGKDFLKSMGRQVVSTFGVNPVPQVALPIVEAATNFSFFTMRPVVGRNVEGLDPRYQVGPATSSMAKMIGENLHYSPMMIDHLVSGYTGTMGMYAVQALDTIMDLNNDSPKASKRFNQLPVIKRFAIDPEARGTVTGYYDLKNSVDEVVRTTNYLERTGNMAEMAKYQQDNMRVLATQGYVKSLNKTMDDFQKIRTMIQGSSMSADAKRDALLNITKAQNQLTSNIQTIRVFAQK